MKIQKNIAVSGKRKRAIAKAIIKEGSGKIIINKIPYQNLGNQLHIYALREPIELAKDTLGNFNFDIVVNVKGGGQEGQLEASRLAIAKALVAITKSNKLKDAFLNYDKHLLIADTRRKETYKPGDSKARSKRQKSYR